MHGRGTGTGVGGFHFWLVFALLSPPVCVNKVFCNNFRRLNRVIVLTLPKPSDDVMCFVSDLAWRTVHSTTYSSEFLVSSLRSGVSFICRSSMVTIVLRFLISLLLSASRFGSFVLPFLLTKLLSRSCHILMVSNRHLINEMVHAIWTFVLCSSTRQDFRLLTF